MFELALCLHCLGNYRFDFQRLNFEDFAIPFLDMRHRFYFLPWKEVVSTCSFKRLMHLWRRNEASCFRRGEIAKIAKPVRAFCGETPAGKRLDQSLGELAKTKIGLVSRVPNGNT